MGASVGRLPPGFKPRNDRNLSRWHAVKGVPGYREVARGRFSARCCAFGTVRAQRRTRAKGGRTASVLAILREGSLPACAQTGGVSRHVASRPRPHLRRGFSLISRAWRALLTSCLAHHRVGLAEPCSRWDSLARSEPLGVVTGDERSRQSSSGEFVQEPHDRGVRIRGGAPGAKG